MVYLLGEKDTWFRQRFSALVSVYVLAQNVQMYQCEYLAWALDIKQVYILIFVEVHRGCDNVSPE